MIFAERIDTLKYLEAQLTKDFKLKPESIVTFSGSLSDMEQQEVIDDFGKKDSGIRLFLTSDAGSQGVNLHYFCNRMFNYDIPWSLITLEQRNGRIDRYGQTQTPYIYYLVAESDLKGLKTDLHILEKLIAKEEEVYNTLGDAGSVMKLYDSAQEEKVVEQAILAQAEKPNEDGLDFSAFFAEQDALFEGESDTTEALDLPEPVEEISHFYPVEADYFEALIQQLHSANSLDPSEAEFTEEKLLRVQNTKEISRVLYDLPPEVRPASGDLYRLSLDVDLVQASITEARKKKGEWAKIQMLYELHPLVRYLMTKLQVSVEKEVALVSRIEALPEDTVHFIFQGQLSNDLGQSVISDFFVIGLDWQGNMHTKPLPLEDFIAQYQLDQQLYTRNQEQDLAHIQRLLEPAIELAQTMHMAPQQDALAARMSKQLKDYEQHLQSWKQEADDVLEKTYAERHDRFSKNKQEKQQREIETILSHSSQYYKDLTNLSNEAYLQVLGVCYNRAKA